MPSTLTITRTPYEEPHHLNLVVRVETGVASAEQEFYTHASDLRSLADAVRGFPRHPDDAFEWVIESGNPDPQLPIYFALAIRPIRATGRCALHFRFHNNEDQPYTRAAEFSIGALPADLDRLSDGLVQFAKLEDFVLRWSVEDDSFV